MSDFTKEKKKDIHENQIIAFWCDYRKLIIGLALAIVIGTSTYMTWRYMTVRNYLTYSQRDRYPILINLCEQIKDKKLHFYNRAKIEQANLWIANDSSGLSVNKRYLKAIELLLSIDEPEAERNRTAFANAYLENGMPGGTLNNLHISKQSIFDLLKLAQERDLRIKEQDLHIKEQNLRIKEQDLRIKEQNLLITKQQAQLNKLNVDSHPLKDKSI